MDESTCLTALVVDDAPFMRSMIIELLTANGINVVGEADNGAVALELYKSLSPGLVVMDVDMPEVNGLEAFKNIKAFDNGAKIIFCTRFRDSSFIYEIKRLGAAGYISKPFKPETFMAEIKRGAVKFKTSSNSG